jgi:hypothetical protein
MHNRRILTMTYRTSKLVLLAAAAFVLATVPLANAGRNPCKREAKADAKDCAAGCKETFQVAKDECLNRDHECVEACRADRSQCRLDSGFDADIDSCNDALETNRALCAPGDDGCIDDAQIAAFQCRDQAREDAKPLLKQCRKDFRTCAQSCGPPVQPQDPAACIVAAKDAARTCAAGCKEAYQAAKDDCRNLNHACVEDCRTGRHLCRQPVRDALDAALAVCAADRQPNVDTCKALYPEPRDFAAEVALDLCIDPFQLAAFICRDNAHEAAQPGFVACRDAFQICVHPACELPPAP